MRREEWGMSSEARGMPHSPSFASHSLEGIRLDLQGICLAEHILRAESAVTPSQGDLRFHPVEA
jgi:hypothetical protein